MGALPNFGLNDLVIVFIESLFSLTM